MTCDHMQEPVSALIHTIRDLQSRLQSHSALAGGMLVHTVAVTKQCIAAMHDASVTELK